MTSGHRSVKLPFVQEAFPLKVPVSNRCTKWQALIFGRAADSPTLVEWGLAVLSAILLIFSFPDFNVSLLAWVALVPLLWVILRQQRRRGRAAFLLGWFAATLFFYGSCYWLTHAMIHYGGLPLWLAYLLLLPATVLVGLFPATWAFAVSRLNARYGAGRALLLAPFAWAAMEWARLALTGQLWNAIGYSQAYTPALIQPARWGGVYAVGFLIVTVNAAMAWVAVRRSLRALASAFAVIGLVALLINLSAPQFSPEEVSAPATAVVVAVQPNVMAHPGRSASEKAELVDRHLTMSAGALRAWEAASAGHSANPSESREALHTSHIQEPTETDVPPEEPARIVIWPESPMNFTYAQDARFREIVARFTREHRTWVLFNSLEPAPAGGLYNSAVMIDEQGQLIAQYDKIRLLPFGEYIPLPRWLPAAWLLSGIVGDFTPGEKYPLMPLGPGHRAARTGVFICFESAFPVIARTFAREGADVLVNISNDGYLGRTPVMRQHLANAILRAVETDRSVLRVTNTGITALITPRGEVQDATRGFEPAVRTWTVSRTMRSQTFYTRHGDLFVMACAVISFLAMIGTFINRQSDNLS